MATISLKISGLSEEILRKLDAKAKKQGRAREEYLRDLIERDVEASQPGELTPMLDLFAPVQEEFARSGMTEPELEALIDEAKKQVGRDMKATPGA